MIKSGFLYCPNCNKKIMPIKSIDTVSATVYCPKCKTYYDVVIAKEKLFEMEAVNMH